MKRREGDREVGRSLRFALSRGAYLGRRNARPGLA